MREVAGSDDGKSRDVVDFVPESPVTTTGQVGGVRKRDESNLPSTLDGFARILADLARRKAGRDRE